MSQFHLDLPPRPQQCSPCQLQAAKDFEMETGIKLQAGADSKQLLSLHREGRLILPKTAPKQMLDPNKQEFTWDGEQSFDSMIDNGKYGIKERNVKFIREIRHGLHAMIDRNVKIIQENGHVIIPYKNTEWEKLGDYRANQNKLSVPQLKSLISMEMKLRPQARAPLLETVKKQFQETKKQNNLNRIELQNKKIIKEISIIKLHKQNKENSMWHSEKKH